MMNHHPNNNNNMSPPSTPSSIISNNNNSSPFWFLLHRLFAYARILLVPALMILAIANCLVMVLNFMNNINDDLSTSLSVEDSMTFPKVAYRTSLSHVEVFRKPANYTPTPNLYELIGKPTKNSLYFTTKLMCSTPVPEKFVSKRIYYRQPSRKIIMGGGGGVSRIPRIIHQSWIEPINDKSHPNLSRLQNSWKASGWEYRWYSNATAAKYIEANFPPEVYEAYTALKPGAFKADLFRYCLLFLEGGLWADVDVQLQSYLDSVLDDSVAFVIPRDMMGHGLHNGMIIAAPGHPILAKAIEESVNRIRNRFTIADITGKYCPDNVKTGVLSEHPDFFLTGAGLLAYAMKTSLGYPLSLPLHPGPFGPELLNYIKVDNSRTILWQTILNNTIQNSNGMPGKTVILRRSVGDMGATRYTDVEKNIIIASTGFSGTYEGEGFEYYSETVQADLLWGLNDVYENMISANEEIRIEIV